MAGIEIIAPSQRQKAARPTPGNWREQYKQAQFRWAIFFVETDTRTGGRRVAPHDYPKKNIGYAEDMGRTSNRFVVQGYLIGRWGATRDDEVNYLQLKNNLIECLEQDGPGMLRLPLPYKGADVRVMVEGYQITESREQGGMCKVEMTFIEYGNPFYRPNISTPAIIDVKAKDVEGAVIGEVVGDDLKNVAQQVAPYAQVLETVGADLADVTQRVDPQASPLSSPIGGGGGFGPIIHVPVN